MLLWVMIGIFLAMSIAFLMGKGASLIAGYNTASRKEKDRYNEKRLCQVMGIGTLMITLSLVGMAVFQEKATAISSVIMLLSVVFILVASNSKMCMNKEDNQGKRPWYKKTSTYTMIFGIGISLIVGVMLFSGSIKIELYESYLKASASSWATQSMEVEYEDITSIDYVSDIDIGSRTWGVGSAAIQAGNFKNEIYGKYKLYSYTNCDEYIVLDTKNGYIVVNDHDEQSTQKLYQNIMLKIKK